MRRILVLFAAVGMVLGTGCAGEDGLDGKDGAPGEQGAPGEKGEKGDKGDQGEKGEPGKDATRVTVETCALCHGEGRMADVEAVHAGATSAQLTLEITEATITDKLRVKFEVTDTAGKGVKGLTTNQLRFGAARLMARETGSAEWRPLYWKSYVNSKAGSVTQATFERNGTLVDNGDGTYEYTYATDVLNAKDPTTNEPIPYDAAVVHRVGIQMSGSLPGLAFAPQNVAFDFIPYGTKVVNARKVVSNDTCNACHGKLTAHGSRDELDNCVVCHNPGVLDPDTGNSVDMAIMTHKIHAAAKIYRTCASGQTACGDKPYKIVGHQGHEYDFSHVGYPQEVLNCITCHNNETGKAPQADNWKTMPSADACGACHVKVNFASHGGANKNNCAGCHSPEQIVGYHATDDWSPRNPTLPAGLADIRYEIKSVAVSGNNEPVVTFRITRDGEPLDFSQGIPAGLTSSPTFLVVYAMPQDGVSDPVDWNNPSNYGGAPGQPVQVRLSSLVGPNATEGSLEKAPGADGYWVATLRGVDGSATFPVGAKLRAVALQGYFSQTVGESSIARHAPSVIGFVAGEERRKVVDDEKCAACHDYHGFHGGNRIYSTQVCAGCHTPNLTGTGRTTDTTKLSEAQKATLTAYGFDPSKPTEYPEATYNLKDMIHSIHAAGKRENPYIGARFSSRGFGFDDFSHVTYPNALNNCEACHEPGTYSAVPKSALATTMLVSDGTDASVDAVKAARAAMPNPTDLVTSPTAAACSSCHDSDLAKAHMMQNGSLIGATRAE